MIRIDYQCEACKGRKGHLEIWMDEPAIVCDNEECGEHEPIRDFDIQGNDKYDCSSNA